jgi:zinc transporter ZupT
MSLICFSRRPSLVDRKHSTTITLGMFILGIVLYMGVKILTKLLFPHKHDQEEVKNGDVEPEETDSVDSGATLVLAGLKTSAVEIAVALALHNIAEGIIIFTSTLANTSIGVNLAIGLIFHKLPEGLIIAMPFYAATKSVWKSLLLAFVASSFFLFFGALLVFELANILVLRRFYEFLEPICWWLYPRVDKRSIVLAWDYCYTSSSAKDGRRRQDNAVWYLGGRIHHVPF